MKLQKRRHKAVTDYALEYYCNIKLCLCSLCGNTGVIDTRHTAISPAGYNAGRRNWCICPNGQLSRIHSNGEQPDQT